MMNKEIHKLLGRKCGSPGEPAQEPIAAGSRWNCTTDRPTTKGKEGQKNDRKRKGLGFQGKERLEHPKKTKANPKELHQ